MLYFAYFAYFAYFVFIVLHYPEERIPSQTHDRKRIDMMPIRRFLCSQLIYLRNGYSVQTLLNNSYTKTNTVRAYTTLQFFYCAGVMNLIYCPVMYVLKRVFLLLTHGTIHFDIYFRFFDSINTIVFEHNGDANDPLV